MKDKIPPTARQEKHNSLWQQKIEDINLRWQKKFDKKEEAWKAHASKLSKREQLLKEKLRQAQSQIALFTQRQGPIAASPKGEITSDDLIFSWECGDEAVISFSVQIVQLDGSKIIHTIEKIPPSEKSYRLNEQDRKNLTKGRFAWTVTARYPRNLFMSATELFSIADTASAPTTGELDAAPHAGAESRTRSAIREKTAIAVDNIGIAFKKAASKKNAPTGRSLASIFSRRRKSETFWALRNLSFEALDGDVIGVVGANGAGKSTLLKLLIGVLIPDEGKIEMNGRVSALLTLGAGFMADLSGRENIYLSATYMGLRKEQIDLIYEDIVAFSELDDFIDTPIRYYSSGMKARLGFSVAVHVDPEILIIDEVLGAGDKNFRNKAELKMKEFMGKAKTIVIATHSTNLILNLCNKCIWLERGRLKQIGTPAEVVAGYLDS